MIVPNFSEKFPEGVAAMEQSYDRPEFLKDAIDLEKLEKTVADDKNLKPMLEEMEDYLHQYTETVLTFNRFFEHGGGKRETPEEATEEENLGQLRERVHNAMIDSINIFGRTLAKSGKDTSFLAGLAPKENRAAYARIALATTFLELKKQKEKGGKR